MTERHVCPPDHAHAETGTCYANHKCRCDDCRRGRAEYEFWRARHPRKPRYTDATGTRRRLQALGALGWSHPALARELDRALETVAKWATIDRVTHATAAHVKATYDRLSMTPPPMRDAWERRSVATTKGLAKRRGWVPPLAWDDDTIDNPDATPATTTGRVHVLDELTHLRTMGESAAIALTAFRQAPETLIRTAERHNRADLAAWIRTAGRAA